MSTMRRQSVSQSVVLGLFLALAVAWGYTSPGALAAGKPLAHQVAKGQTQPNKLLSCSGSLLTSWNLTVRMLREDMTQIGCVPEPDSEGGVGYRGQGLSPEHAWAINLRAKYRNGGTTITHLAAVRTGGGTDFLPSSGNSIGIAVNGATLTGICGNRFNDYNITWNAPTSITVGGVVFSRISMEWKLNTMDSDAFAVQATAGGASCVNASECDREDVDVFIDVDSNCPGGVFEDDWFAKFIFTTQQG